jgi:hypothetical protein
VSEKVKVSMNKLEKTVQSSQLKVELTHVAAHKERSPLYQISYVLRKATQHPTGKSSSSAAMSQLLREPWCVITGLHVFPLLA